MHLFEIQINFIALPCHKKNECNHVVQLEILSSKRARVEIPRYKKASCLNHIAWKLLEKDGAAVN